MRADPKTILACTSQSSAAQNAVYDLETDRSERHNLISVPAFQADAERLRRQPFAELANTGALNVPVRVPAGERLDQRKLPR